MYYREIDIPNLELLQEQVLSILPNDLYASPRVYFPVDQSRFLNLSGLTNLLDVYNLKHDATAFAFYIMRPYSEGSVHVDWGDADYSMNIPIMNCNNTFTNFYKHTGEPELVPERYIQGVVHRPHYKFDNVKLEKIDQFESNIPCVIHIKTPHNVVNPQSSFRINLLIRYRDNSVMSSLINGTLGRIRTDTV
jgi:hypothetical protein